MKSTRIIFISTLILLVAVFSCSCSRNSSRAIDRAINRGENAIDRGIGSKGNGVEDSMDITTGDTYGANSGYSGNVGTGTGTSLPYSGRPTELLPTLGDKHGDNKGQINTNNGNTDGGTGDKKRDNDMSANFMHKNASAK